MSCCDTLKSDLAAVSAKASGYGYLIPPVPNYPMWFPLDQYEVFFNELGSIFPKFLPVPETPDEVPNIEAMLQAISTPLDTGFGQWAYFNVNEPGKTVLTLPQAPTKSRVDLNGARLASPKDYSLAGATLTLVHPLAIGDLLTLYSYGV